MKSNIITGALLFALSAILYYLIPSQITMIKTKRLSMSPAFYPRGVIIAMALLSLLFAVSSFLQAQKIGSEKKDKMSDRESHFFGENFFRTLITMAILLAYIYLVEFLGFLIATPVALGALMYHMGTRRIRTFCLIMTIVPLITYFLFERVMLVILPRGVFF